MAMTKPDASQMMYLGSGSGAVERTVQSKGRDTVSVADFMTAAQIADAKTNAPVLDHTSALVAAITFGGNIRMIDNSTLRLTTSVNLDVAFSSFVGCGSVLDFSASTTGGLKVFSSATYGTQRIQRNWTHSVQGIAFKGNKVAGFDLVTIGHATYTENSEITFRGCSFSNAARLIVFINNAWRTNFDSCGFEGALTNYFYFNSPANSGEVMGLHRCWIVDSTNAYVYLNEGQWMLSGCSFPGGGIGGIQVLGAAQVVIRDSNIETQPAAASQRVIEGYQSSNIRLEGCIVATNGGLANKALIIVNDACGLHVNGCTLPLYGDDLRSEATDGVRELVTGSSQYVTSTGNYVKGTGANDRTKWAVFSRQTNLLRNGNAEAGNILPWVFVTYGGNTTGTFTSSTVAPKVGSRNFVVDCPANGGVEATQTISGASAYIGRALVFGMWAMAVGGTGTVDFPTVRFLDSSGTQIGTSQISVFSTDTSYTWIGGYGVVPVGTDKIVMVVGGQQQAAAHKVYYDEIILNVI